jgi:hypothetical protein
MMQCLNGSENSGSSDSLTSNFSQAEAPKWATEYKYGSIPSVASSVGVIYSLKQYRFYPLIISNKSANQTVLPLERGGSSAVGRGWAG